MRRRIALLRRKSGMSGDHVQDMVATITGIKRGTINGYCSGRLALGGKNGPRIAAALDMEWSALLEEIAGEVIMEMKVPFVEKADLEVFRHGHELYVQIGPYRRSFVLPDTLRRREVTKAKLDSGLLRVTFEPKSAKRKRG